MARSLSWIDPERLAALIEVVSPSGESSSASSSGFGGLIDEDELAVAQQPSFAAPASAQPRATPVPAAPPQPKLPPFQPSPEADLGTRLDEFVAWAADALAMDGVVVTDADGLVILAWGADRVEPAMTCSVDLLLNHVRDVLQSEVRGHVALQSHGWHCVTLWTPTEYGRFYGVLISKAVPAMESLMLADQGFRALFAN